MVKHLFSTRLTPQHVDMTNEPVNYAPPKAFIFISKKQMKWIDANRWSRQVAGDAKIVPIEDLTPEMCSIDNRNALIMTLRRRSRIALLVQNWASFTDSWLWIAEPSGSCGLAKRELRNKN
jgi:hypothetical protein